MKNQRAFEFIGVNIVV